MKQVLIKDGGVLVAEVPAPGCGSRSVLVAVEHSCISAGTEMASVANSGMPLYRRALRQPENVRRVLEMARDQGLMRTLDRVRGKLAFGVPTGYSAAGRVIAVGADVQGISAGDRVACAGAGYANHAEFIEVPVNLVVSIPDSLDTQSASTVTLGAIALQGVRRCDPTLGETVVVVGLGVLGQLTVQMLRANGCRTIGVDVDPARIALAETSGVDVGLNATEEDYVAQVFRVTDGIGADASIITAAGSSDEIVSRAFRSCRRKGRVILVGDVGLSLVRSELYAKELDFLVSTSYGPGRYDPVYEEGGNDYPIAYVRWTENRNMEAYLRMVAEGKVSLDHLLGNTFDIGRAAEAYAQVQSGTAPHVLTLLSYPTERRPDQRSVTLRTTQKMAANRIRIAVAGAGGFAQGMHLPNLIKLRDRFSIRAVMSRTGSNATAVATQFGADFATTDYIELLQDPNVDAILITTRHDLHAHMALQALRAGKHVLVEKPLALHNEELREIENFFTTEGSAAPLIMTGFNRRFSPAIAAARTMLDGRRSPIIVNYRMNAGYLPRDHWVHGREGGGRNIGEACHIYDLFNCLTGSKPAAVKAIAIAPNTNYWARNDNFAAVVSYADGSLCTLTYTAMGDRSYPKERMEIFSDGKVIALDDYRRLDTGDGRRKVWSSLTIRKGQFEELVAFSDAIRSGLWPITLAEQLSATRLSFDVEAQLRAS